MKVVQQALNLMIVDDIVIQDPSSKNDIDFCTHVVINHDKLKTPLTMFYSDPHRIIRKHTKYFEILVKVKKKVISISLLKPIVE